jgi:hypothetical protein
MPTEKLAAVVGAHASLATEHREGRHDLAATPTVTILGFPKPRFVMTLTAPSGLLKPGHTVFRKPGLTGKMSHTVFTIFTNRVEHLRLFAQNPMAVGPRLGGRNHVRMQLLRVLDRRQSVLL